MTILSRVCVLLLQFSTRMSRFNQRTGGAKAADVVYFGRCKFLYCTLCLKKVCLSKKYARWRLIITLTIIGSIFKILSPICCYTTV